MRRNARRKDAYLKELEKWKVSFHAGGNFKKKKELRSRFRPWKLSAKGLNLPKKEKEKIFFSNPRVKELLFSKRLLKAIQ